MNHKVKSIRQVLDSIKINRTKLAKPMGMSSRKIFDAQSKIRKKMDTLTENSVLLGEIYTKSGVIVARRTINEILDVTSYREQEMQRLHNFLGILDKWKDDEVSRKDPHDPVPRVMQYPHTDEMANLLYPFDWITKEAKTFMKKYPKHKKTLEIKRAMRKREKEVKK